MSQANNHGAANAITSTTSDQLSVDSKGGLRSSRFDDIYYNAKAGAEESRYVFLEGNHLTERWQALFTAPPELPHNRYFVIGETGFGTGLNFFSACELWQQQYYSHANLTADDSDKQTRHTLYFYSTELYPLSLAAMEKALAHYNPLPHWSAQLLTQYPDAIGGEYLLHFTIDDHCDIKLVLLFGESETALSSLERYAVKSLERNPINSLDPDHFKNAGLKVDAWFLDGFTPSRNPSIWNSELFNLIANLSHSRTTVASFTVARPVRDELNRVGFKITKRKGFGTKREMLMADVAPMFGLRDSASNHQKANVHLLAHSMCYFRSIEPPAEKEKTALVIGSGIAGCSIAYQLASRGYQVTLCDQSETLATGASGNDQAVLYARTAKQRAVLADFHEASFSYAKQFYAQLDNKRSTTNHQYNPTGMLKLGEQLEQSLINLNGEMSSRRNVTAIEASDLAGLAIKQNAIYYPQAGQISPRVLCNQLASHPNIQQVFDCKIISLSNTPKSSNNKNKTPKRWQADSESGGTFFSDNVVICNAEAAKHFSQTQWLPLKSIRGQTTELPVSANSQSLKMTVCAKGYITPALHTEGDRVSQTKSCSTHSVGASFNLDDKQLTATLRDHLDNLNHLKACLPSDSPFAKQLTDTIDTALGNGDVNPFNGRVGFRCVSPDYLPMAGAVVDADAFKTTFASLKKNAKQVLTETCPPIPGLFVNAAYGSHGFTTAPLAAEILAAQINGSPVPCSDKLRQSLSPSRFLVRQLIRDQ